MKKVLRELFSSKKFTVALLAVIVWVVGLFGFDATTEQVGAVVSPLMVFILGQGFADGGGKKPTFEGAPLATLETSEPKK